MSENWKIYAFADEASPELDGQIAALQRNKLLGPELRGVNGKSVTELTADEAREVRRRLDDAGLTVWSLGSPIGKITLDDDFEAHLELLRHTLELGNILGAEAIRLFSFYPGEGQRIEDCFGQVGERMGRMLDVIADSGILPCHENEKGIFGYNADGCLKLHKTFPALQAVFDPANFIQSGQATLPAWEQLHEYVAYFHVKDAFADGSVVPAGCGEGHVEELLRAYREQGGYRLTVEPHLTVFDGLKALERAGEESAVGRRYSYPSADAAFDAATTALRGILAAF